MNNAEAVNWLINITADIGKVEHQDLWHYEQALSEIREMLEDAPQRMRGRWETDAYGAMDDGEYLITRCSACGTAYEYGHDDRYCGFCGADMREE